MKVANNPEGQRHSCPGDFVKAVQLDMDQHGTHSTSHRQLSGIRVSSKSKAPSPPPSLKGLDDPGLSQRCPGYPHSTMDQKENLLEKDLTLVVVLPGGVEKITTVHGSKPMMDLLVMLCARHHLNPSGHTIELVTTNRNHIKFKPNALIGTLEAEKILLKAKGVEDKNKKACPQMPEASVRLVINYKKTQKTILRVSPRVPLEELLPAICEKCEFDLQTTVLLRDVQSLNPLDLTSSLNDCGIREVYAKDTKGLCSTDRPSSPVCPASPSHYSIADTITPGKDKNQKEKENKGLFSLFRRSKKKPEQSMTASAPASPVLTKPRPLSMASLGAHCSTYESNTMPLDMPKKRRAPLPPGLVSHSCPSDLSSRQRLNSEPEAQTDKDQLAGLSRGSSTESSLKRTKRKAPPPPTSPTVAVQNEASLDGSLKGSPAPMTLEEIVEQEETTASMVLDFVTSSDVQEDDSSLNLSADVSMDSERAEVFSRAPEGQIQTSPSPPLFKSAGEDQPGDLSSDGKPAQGTVDTEDSDAGLRVEMSSTGLADTGTDPCQEEAVSEQTDSWCKDSVSADGVEGEVRAEGRVSSIQPAPSVVQEAGSQASGQPYTGNPTAENVLLEEPVASSTPCPPAEDAQVQTEFTQQEVPPPAKPSTLEAVGQKRDMATSTEELSCPELGPALIQASDASPCQNSSLSAPTTPSATPAVAPATGLAAAKAAPFHVTDSKPKPSNEVTRDYIPKVGMTTYTIVPQKSLEKLKFFEVELTLVPCPKDPEQEVHIGSLKLEDCTAHSEQYQVRTEQTPVQSTAPREDSSQTEGTTTSDSTVNSSLTGLAYSPPTQPSRTSSGVDKILAATNGELQAALIAEVKEMKLPPATKPKPGSFRLPQHKRTPGYYVTSAAVKSGSASPGADQKKAPASLERETPRQAVDVELFPPPPPPVHCQEESTGGTEVQQSPKEDKSSVPFSLLTRQSSLPTKEPTAGLSLEKLRTFAAPRPYSPSSPSRFAQAVSSAVKRSQSVLHSPTSPRSPPFCPITGRFSMKEPKGLFNSMETDNREEGEDKGSAKKGGADESGRSSASDMTAQMASLSQPEQCLSACTEEHSSNGTTDTFTKDDVLPLGSPEPEPSTQE